MNPRVFILAGPTASGKSSLALDLAARFPFEIVNADSLQLFRHLDIGSAKPTPEERKKVPHRMINVLDPDQPATAGWFAKEVRQVISDITDRNKIPLVVGGSGFYLRALEHPPKATPTSFLINDSGDDYEYLKTQDPETAKKIHPNDRYRIARAVSLLRKGERPSERWNSARSEPAPFDLHWLGLEWDRKELYERIDRRMERMFERGLVEETRAVAEKFPNALSRLSRSIGYRQALGVLQEKKDPKAMVEEAKTRSRQYAKRQTTWFRRESRIIWISGKNPLSGAAREIERVLTP